MGKSVQVDGSCPIFPAEEPVSKNIERIMETVKSLSNFLVLNVFAITVVGLISKNRAYNA
jgi:hypothetical protein